MSEIVKSPEIVVLQLLIAPFPMPTWIYPVVIQILFDFFILREKTKGFL